MSVVNPYTGRKIKIGGATYMKISKSTESKILWRDICPYSLSERKTVAQKCNPEKCFLRPQTLGYPVCPKIKNIPQSAGIIGECQPHCLGINAAYKRARQYKEQSIADKALQLKVKFNC